MNQFCWQFQRGRILPNQWLRKSVLWNTNADDAAEMLFVIGNELVDCLHFMAAAFGVEQGSTESVAC